MIESSRRWVAFWSKSGIMVKWGILSTARINRRVIPAIRMSRNAMLHAVASRDAKRARTYADTWDIETSYGRYEELLTDDEIDVVYISLPNSHHTEWTLKALKAGKHVLCEKPLCTTLEDIASIEEASKQAGRQVSEAFMYLHHPQTALFKSIIDEGRIGELRSMQSNFTYTWSREEDNYRLHDVDGGGSLWDIGVYPISFFQLLTGSEPVYCSGTAYPGAPDMRFGGLLQYPKGVIGTFYCAFDTHFSTETVIHGSEGRLRITHPYNYMEKGKAWLENDSVSEELELPQAPLYQLEVEDMNAVVMEGRAPFVGLDRSRGVLNTVLKLRKGMG